MNSFCKPYPNLSLWQQKRRIEDLTANDLAWIAMRIDVSNRNNPDNFIDARASMDIRDNSRSGDSSDDSSSDEPEDAFDLKCFIRDYCLTHGITRDATRGLLSGLREAGPDELPRNPRNLLQTPKTPVQTKPIGLCGRCIQDGINIGRRRVLLQNDVPLQTYENYRAGVPPKYANSESPFDGVVDVINDIPIDPMHLYHLGVGKKHLRLSVVSMKRAGTDALMIQFDEDYVRLKE
ncbi:hypothetical protein QAD02_011908 [Eretmocerus hayati]|uniref:Uncharacterized protein n=1 Tax=Eretmocerus hayati TaxID=131215 RepID=A0ACC2P0Z4_9HYME|nr:hypothetical protein QAD02_011908 [Eretmocerus hayati]